MIVNIVATAILVLILGGAVAYIVRSKKNGVKCIGCPSGCCTRSSEEKKSDNEDADSACGGCCSSCSCCSNTSDTSK